MKKIILVCILVGLNSNLLFSQKLTDNYIKEQIAIYKNELRGPYKDIRWFCKDGSVRMPKEPCPDSIGPGVQHARYKDIVENIGKKNHVFLGQILAYTAIDEFWDVQNQQSRLKQYQLDKYLRSVDDGWINSKGQYYRGSIQAEDEEAWGVDFYKWLLAGDKNVTQNYFLIRQSLKDIPHKGDDNLSQLMRSQSKVLSDMYTAFMDLRVKIHGQPIEALLENLTHKVDGVRQRTRVELSARDGDAVISATQKWMRDFAPNDETESHHLLEALWLHQQHHVRNDRLLESLLSSKVGHAAMAAKNPLVDKFLSAKFESHAEQEQVALSRLPLRLSDQ